MCDKLGHVKTKTKQNKKSIKSIKSTKKMFEELKGLSTKNGFTLARAINSLSNFVLFIYLFLFFIFFVLIYVFVCLFKKNKIKKNAQLRISGSTKSPKLYGVPCWRCTKFCFFCFCFFF